jgi:hypothetical protein
MYLGLTESSPYTCIQPLSLSAIPLFSEDKVYLGHRVHTVYICTLGHAPLHGLLHSTWIKLFIPCYQQPNWIGNVCLPSETCSETYKSCIHNPKRLRNTLLCKPPIVSSAQAYIHTHTHTHLYTRNPVIKTNILKKLHRCCDSDQVRSVPKLPLPIKLL